MMPSTIAKPLYPPHCFLSLFRSMGSGARSRFPKHHKRKFPKDYESDEVEHGQVALWKGGRLFRQQQGQGQGQRQRHPEYPKNNRKNHVFAIDENKYNTNATKDDTFFQSTGKSHRQNNPQPSSRTRRKAMLDDDYNDDCDDDLDDYGPADGYSSGAWKKKKRKPSPGRLLKERLQLPLKSLPKNIQSMVPDIKNYIIKRWLKLYPDGGHLRKLQRDIAYRMDNSPGKLEHEHLLPIVAVLVEEGKIELDAIRNKQGTITIRRPPK